MIDDRDPFDFDALFAELWPICRSITGPGLRESLRILDRAAPIELREFESGLTCFDWTIPDEWAIRGGWIRSRDGRTIVDFASNNLHVVNYSEPIRRTVSRTELLEHVHTLPDRPDVIPYRTAYYTRDWGFCLEHRRLAELTDEEYEVCIDADLAPGSLTIGEGRLVGEREDEIVFTTYPCHPSMANNELSGPLVQTELYRRLHDRTKRRFSYRFVYAPETIGDIVYLAHEMESLRRNMIGGAVLTMVANDAPMMFEPSGRSASIFDRAARNVLAHRYPESSLGAWNPKGRAAQRQYCSPGLRLPLSVLSRAIGGTYPEYHTSLDTREAISRARHDEAVTILMDIVDVIEQNDRYINQRPFGEPFLSKYDLGTRLGGERIAANQLHYKCLLQMADGESDLLEVAETLGICMLDLIPAVDDLVGADLLRPAAMTATAPTGDLVT